MSIINVLILLVLSSFISNKPTKHETEEWIRKTLFANGYIKVKGDLDDLVIHHKYYVSYSKKNMIINFNLSKYLKDTLRELNCVKYIVPINSISNLRFYVSPPKIVDGILIEAWNDCIMFIETSNLNNALPVMSIRYQANEDNFQTPIDTLFTNSCGLNLFKTVIEEGVDQQITRSFSRLSILNGGKGVYSSQ
ncbi:MAG: hypothetical protein MH472_13695 [Bacteroidia bacterium]|nr:hypothetical protein [Bacteroidia bacterium]